MESRLKHLGIGPNELDGDDESRLSAAIAAGGPGAAEAEAELVAGNLALVAWLARREERLGGLPFDLAFSAGSEALVWAARSYDPSRGWKFNTYAGRAIRHAIHAARSVELDAVPIPSHAQQKRDATRRKVALSWVRPHCQARIAAAAEAVARVEPLGDRRAGELVDRPGPDPDAPALVDALPAALGRLGPRERDVIRLRFGLDGAEPRTFGELGEALGLSRRRVAQIQAAALERLRSDPALAN